MFSPLIPLPRLIAVYLAAVNLLAFVLMGFDKRRARRQGLRVPEKALFLFPLLGGSLGGVLGMRLFRHKTLHGLFRFGFPALLVLHLAATALLLCRRYGVLWPGQ